MLFFRHSAQNSLDNRQVNYARFAHSDEKIGCASAALSLCGVAVNIPESVTTIGQYAFWQCALEEVTLLPTVTEIKWAAFKYNDGLVIYGIPGSEAERYANSEGITFVASPIDFSFFNFSENEDGTLTITGYKGKETEITIPKEYNGATVTNIEEYAFDGNTTIRKIALQDNFTSVPELAFYGCDELEEVELADTITKIGIYSFEFCHKLKTVNCKGKINDISVEPLV